MVDKSPSESTVTANGLKERAAREIGNSPASTSHVAKEEDVVDMDANLFSFPTTEVPADVNSTTNSQYSSDAAKEPRLSRIFSYKSRSYKSTKTAGTGTTKVID